MKDIYEQVKRGCGIDIDSLKLWASTFVTSKKGTIEWETKVFDNTVDGIEELIEWLKEKKTTHVAFESTGCYWQMLYSFLEDSFEVIVANPRQTKPLKGKKRDPDDAKQIARLLQMGSIIPSFIPPRNVRELRDLTRQHVNITEDIVRVKNRITKTLREASITLDAHLSDLFGVSGRAMIQGLIAGMPGDEIAELAKRRLISKIPQIKDSLRFPLSDHYRRILFRYWKQFTFLEEELESLEKDLDEKMKPFLAVIKRLQTIPGCGMKAARDIISEIGNDMSRFPKDKNLCSWAKVCPGNNSSGGKRKSGRNSKGNRYLRRYLGEVAWAAVRTKGSEFRDQYLKKQSRLGKKKAIVAIMHKILRIIYHMLSKGEDYQTNYEREKRKDPRKALIGFKLKNISNEDLISELLSRGMSDIKWDWDSEENAVSQ